MNVFEKIIKVLPEHLDDLNHVNNVQYVQWMQDIAKEHWEKMVPNHINEKMIWVVRSHNITYKKSALLGQNIRIQTYISENRGFLSFRVVKMFLDKTKDVLIDAHTQWCLLDSQTLRPKRVPEEVSNIFL